MISFLEFDETGVFVANAGRAKSLPDGALELPEEMTPREALALYAVGGVLIPRPSSPAPVPSDNGWVVRGCEVGTHIEIFDLSGDEVLFDGIVNEAQDVALSFPDPGQYEVHVFAPLPAFPTKTTIEVQDATNAAALPIE